MDSVYELYSKRTNYRVMKENVSSAINVLSRTSLNDNLSTAIAALDNSYVINGVSYKGNVVKKVKENLATDLSNLNVILSSISSKINNLSTEIEELDE